MPEMLFDVRWPDGARQTFYSPSLIVREYLEAGQDYPLADFVDRVRTAMGVAEERVRAKYGMGCSMAPVAVAQVEAVQAEMAAAGLADGAVRVERFRT
ncbi:MSMEG_0570 family nitrogen starvation response protein [Pseudonocardia sp. KRD-169]|uniref:MSMEG_0570 family nitrogen starvation response protein n=2 Tax=Pseudonocardia abyssalis TaxID=2792008 RepID=A0ABS6UNZ6_9PSEU|nr:MSMEG_0570 family nitrogen starvation response protein [Pseudonocardia abyssalis]MBW0133618.1 MSMEG_0570 family nitrogen starvation response protein [Pseudonocardia abyssalis]